MSDRAARFYDLAAAIDAQVLAWPVEVSAVEGEARELCVRAASFLRALAAESSAIPEPPINPGPPGEPPPPPDQPV